MSRPAIRIESLSKCYRLGETHEYTLSDQIARAGARLFGRRPISERRAAEDFWALRDVSLSINEGEAVGIIGSNGAGKSTLLKILSRITPPTSGRALVRGRLSSLLEVGTGFHPELTGRENVFLNGAILGMRRAEVVRKFDEIVAFSGVERFVDTPVKRYSSGMYVRLAFAVAAYLEPDILIIDEVLAVGDAEFQKRCLAKMDDVARGGRTVLFVSHNMASIQNLCSRCLLLREGQIAQDGKPHAVVAAYLEDDSVTTSFIREPQSNGKPTIIRGKLAIVGDADHQRVHIELTVFGGGEQKVNLDQRLFDASCAPVGAGSLAGLRDDHWIALSGDQTQVVISFPVDMLVDGRYFVSLDLTLPGLECFDRLEHGLTFDLSRSPKFGRRRLSQNSGWGVVEFPLRIESLVQH